MGYLARTIACLSFSCFCILSAQQPKATETEQPQPRDSRLESTEANKTTGAPVDLKTYVIGPDDILLIRVWREPDLTGPVVVRPDGDITLPLVRDIKAAGLTPAQLQGQLADGLSKFINKPDVLVSVQAVRSKKYLMSGEITRPGTYPLILPTTVLEAIVNAGGLRDFAKSKNIVVIRGNERFKFNYNDVIKGKHPEQNILLQHNDHVHIP